MEGGEIRRGRRQNARISAPLEGVEGRSGVPPCACACARTGAHTIMTLYSLSNPSNHAEICGFSVLPSSIGWKDASFQMGQTL